MSTQIDHYIYFDHAATTAVRPEVYTAMQPYLTQRYGNPSSIYRVARDSKKDLELAREKVANAIGAQAGEVFFTGSGTEADNWAILGVLEANENKGKHIITSCIEHHAVLHTCMYLEKKGYEVTYLPVNEEGIVDIGELERALRPDTVLISIMFANNEIGTIQPITEIGALARKNKIIFHTDAVQAVGHVPIDVSALQVDLLSISAHKLYGPKGVGALYIRKGTKIKPILHGGAQEKNRRAGTENMPGIIGFSEAITLAVAELEQENQHVLALRDQIIDGVLQSVPHTRLNGHREQRLPGNVNISFEFIEGESLLLLLDMQGIFASSGSACTSGSLDPSHVLLAIGLPHEKAHGSLRISLGRENTTADVSKFLSVLPMIVTRLRDMSPLYEDYIKGKS